MDDAVRARILVAEDSPCIAEMLKMALGDDGFDVELAGDGREALDRLAASPAQLVVLDVVMPKVDGWAVLASMRNGERTRDTPVVVMSTVSNAKGWKAAQARGGQAYIEKPFVMSDFLRTVRTLIEVKQLGGRRVDSAATSL